MRLANFDDLVSPLPWAFLHNQDPKRTLSWQPESAFLDEETSLHLRQRQTVTCAS